MSVVTAMTADTSSAPPPSRSSRQADLIARGQISLDAAGDLLELFKRKMNQYLWGGIAMSYVDLDSVRNSSTLLSTVIFAIASLHLADREQQFDICYADFIDLVAQISMACFHTLDDVRALILGAFWFPDLSWKLSGLAVRMSTELNVHRHFNQFLRGDEQKLEEARIWCLLYVCDHHFSIANGRPSMMLGTIDIRAYDSLLGKLPKQAPDERLLAQVSLFIHLSNIYQKFGFEMIVALDDGQLSGLQQHMNQIEHWRSQWESRLGKDLLL